MKIGILSDTHNMLRNEVLETLRDCDVILHAGDAAKPEILDELRQIAPLKVVRGNNDRAWAEDIPRYLHFELEGYRFFMTHKRMDIPSYIANPVSLNEGNGAAHPSGPEDGTGRSRVPADIVIFGHSHKYEEYRKGPVLFLNPGSCGPRRFTQPITMAVMEIGDGGVRIQKIEIEHRKKPANVPPASDMNLIIIGAVRDIKKGLSIHEIARKYNISDELSEQICRMYLTHPGIDAQGIINKMELRSHGL